MSIREELTNLLSRLLGSENYELVELEYHREGSNFVLRVFADKAGGITLDDCARLSEKIGSYLDEKNIIPGSYVLEVSSPGLNRPLKKESDFQKFSGCLVKVNLYAVVEEEKYFVARLIGIEEKKVKFNISGTKTISVPLENIASARLEVEL